MRAASHGGRRTIAEAVDRALEVEETARIYFLLRHDEVRRLSNDEVYELLRVFRSRG